MLLFMYSICATLICLFWAFTLYYLLIRVHLLTYWSFLVGEKCGAVAAIHVSHAYTVTVSPVKLPVMGVGIL